MSSWDESSWWWPVAIVAFLVILSQNLWRAGATGIAEMRNWEVRRSENRAAFWFTVTAEIFFVIVGVVLLARWLFSAFKG